MENPINQDWFYYRREVDVYKVVTSAGTFYVSSTQGETIKDMLVEQEGKDRFITIGGATIRLFIIQALVKERKKFYELPKELKAGLLKSGTVFTQEELASLSDGLKASLDALGGRKLLNG